MHTSRADRRGSKPPPTEDTSSVPPVLERPVGEVAFFGDLKAAENGGVNVFARSMVE